MSAQPDAAPGVTRRTHAASARLSANAAQLRQSLAGDLGADNKRAEIGMLSTLAGLYASSHKAETARILAMTDQQRAQQGAGLSGMDAVWKSFDIRVAMLETLARGLMNLPASSGAGGGPQPQAFHQNEAAPGAAMPPPPVQQPPAQPAAPPVFQAPPAAPPPVQQAAPPAGNPMSMFSKKPADGAAAPPPQPAPPQVPPQAPPAQSAPVPPAPPQQNQPSGSPMSFFKGPPKQADGNQ